MTDRMWRRIALIAVVIYAAIVLCISLRHEAWGDEADPWLVARDADLPTLFRLASPMGTPVLWYLALMPLAKSGLPFAAMYVLNVAFGTAAIALVLFKAPLPRLMRLAFAFGFFAVYEYGVIARPYGLMMLLMFAVAAAYEGRLRRPVVYGALIALLANVTAHGTMIAAVLGALFLFDAWRTLKDRGIPVPEPLPSVDRPHLHRKKIFAGLAIAFVGGLLAAWQLWPRQDAPIPGFFIIRNPAVWDSVAANLFFLPRSWASAMTGMSRAVVPLLALLLLVALLDRPRALTFMLLCFGCLLYLYTVKWYQNPRHAGVVLLVVMVTLWIACVDPLARMSARIKGLARFARRGAMGFVTVGLVVSIVPAVEWLSADFSAAFNHSREVAAWVHANSPPDEIIVGDSTAETVLAYLPRDRRLWFGHRRAFGTYSLWTLSDNTAIFTTTSGDIVHAAEAALPHHLPVLFVLSLPLENPGKYGYEEVYRTKKKPIGYYFHNDHYFLYRRGSAVNHTFPENTLRATF